MKAETNNRKFKTPGRASFESKKDTQAYKDWFRNELIRKEGKCDECQKYMHVQRPGETGHNNDLATVDHIIPLNRGGSNGYQNLRIICWKCNYLKGLSEQRNKDIKTWRGMS